MCKGLLRFVHIHIFVLYTVGEGLNLNGHQNEGAGNNFLSSEMKTKMVCPGCGSQLHHKVSLWSENLDNDGIIVSVACRMSAPAFPKLSVVKEILGHRLL